MIEISETGRMTSGGTGEGFQYIFKKPMTKTMREELRRIERRIRKAERRLKNPKYSESESLIIDKLMLRKLEILGNE